MKKVLFVAHVDSHIRHFHLPYLKYFKEKGYEVHVATSNDENEKFPNCDVKHTISFERSPFKLNNIRAIFQMKKLLSENDFTLVHCHTPMGGVVTRLACKKAKKNGTKIFYTGHGLHFYHGAPIKNWILYYPIEKHLSRLTDVLITINKEDFEITKKRFKAKRNYLVHGVGVDSNKFNENPLSQEESSSLKEELHILENDFCIFYVAELIPRKNQMMMIHAMKDIIAKNNHIKLFLVGNGILTEMYQNEIKKEGLQNYINMLGYRKDVPKLLKVADLCVSTSTQEGLGLNLVEGAFSRCSFIGK